FQANAQEETGTGADGFVPIRKNYRNIAFVTVEQAGRPLAQIPVEIVGDQTLVCFVPVDEQVAKRGQLDQQKDRWLKKLGDSLAVQRTLFQELSDEKEVERALQRARAGRDGLNTDLKQRTAELDSLRQAARSQGLEQQLDITLGLRQFKELEACRTPLDA